MTTPPAPSPLFSLRGMVLLALALSLAAAISLGVTRFAYSLLLPVMRADLHWSYAVSGTMNTVNAGGYLVGALLMPRLVQHISHERIVLASALLASVLMAVSGLFTDTGVLLALRLLAGALSATLFVGGGLLAARLSSYAPAHGGLLLGLYYGGTGWGIAGSALWVPLALELSAGHTHSWQSSWWLLGGMCLLAMIGLLLAQPWLHRLWQQTPPKKPAPVHAGAAGTPAPDRFRWSQFGFALAAYFQFGLGYIGYMTFIIALLRSSGASSLQITVFYTLLGLAVVASGRIWARLLDRYHGGQVLAILSALLGLATVLPVLSTHPLLAIVSGVLFGATFLSVVASTTALVRHNLAPDAWVSGISAFTIVFAVGQVLGPVLVGWISDGPGGLQRGFLASALALWLGALLASRQKALTGH